MAVDKKSDHVGNHGGKYTDIDGQSRQFTYIDHDKKTKISTSTPNEDPNWYMEFLKTHRASVIKQITSLPPSICPEIFSDYTLRGDSRDQIEWNVDMLLDAGIPMKQLEDILRLTENKLEMMRLTK